MLMTYTRLRTLSVLYQSLCQGILLSCSSQKLRTYATFANVIHNFVEFYSKYWCWLLKCDPDKYAVHIFAEKLLAAAIQCYLWFPHMSKILSQDEKKFAKIRQIFRVHEIFFQTVLVLWITFPGSVKVNLSNFLKRVSFQEKFGEIWRFFLSCDKIFDTSESHR